MDKLMAILSELHPGVDFTTHTGLIAQGVLDSFDIVTLVTDIEDAYGVVIPPEDIIPDNFNSARSLYDLICRLGA